ncbi:DUF4268 domain-containing protein [Chitinophaga sp.]|uniref:DUF4268 domain-containing protein n=1 Tax=Chitinophaga sp. TaxID=1869181 RepID=UPI00261E46E7|nr:DUF4268 domain-containing protein [uncultured Chitinophaga sp.]
MYSKEETSRIREAFWTAFGQYIAPHMSAEGGRVNWTNYKTGVKHIYFRMQAGSRDASISIEIAHPDEGIQELFFEQFLQFRAALENHLGEVWTWELHAKDDYGKTISRIYMELPGVNIFRQEDWPALISFFKPRIIALDVFWSEMKYPFEELS